MSSAAEAAPPTRPIVLAAALAAVVIAADRITKAEVRSNIPLDGTRHVLGSVVELVHYRNTGVAFDFLSGAGPVVPIVGGLALIALIVYFVHRPARRGMWVATGLLVGGALGNLIDRLIDGSVTDFIKFPHWPAFNVSDIAVTFGVIVLVWAIDRSTARR